MKLMEVGVSVLVLSTVNMIYHQYVQHITKEYILGTAIGGFIIILIAAAISLYELYAVSEVSE